MYKNNMITVCYGGVLEVSFSGYVVQASEIAVTNILLVTMGFVVLNFTTT